MTPSGGAHAAAKRLVLALNVNGCRSELLSPHSDEWLSSLERLTRSRERINYKVVPKRPASGAFTLLDSPISQSSKEFLKTRAGRARILHLHWMNSVSLSSQLLAIGPNIFWTLHDEWPITGGCHYDLDCDQLQRGCGQCPQVRSTFRPQVRAKKKQRGTWSQIGITYICPSRWMKMRVETSIPGATAIHIPNPVDEEYISASGKYSDPKRDFGDTEDVMTVGLFAADWRDPRKRGSALRDILAALPGNRVIFRIAGLGGEEVFPRDSRLQLVGRLSNSTEVIDFLQGCDLNLHLAEADNLPNTLIEAMAVGVPNVAVKSGGVEDAVIHLETGLLADSIFQVPSLLEFALASVKRRINWSNASKRYAKATFSASVVAEQITDAYDRSLAGLQ